MIKFKAKIIKEITYTMYGYGVYLFDTDDKIKGKSNNATSLLDIIKSSSVKLIGIMPKLTEGCEYNVEAEEEHNPKFGMQYKVKNISLSKPEDKDSLLKYLKTLCTNKQAISIVNKYPNFINEVIADNDLALPKGISKKSFDKIKEKVLESYIMNDILALLGPLGITYKTIMKLSDTHKTALELKQILYENPYVLTRVHGLGFAKVDNIALQINPELKVSKYRLNAYIKYLLSEQANTNGHTIVDIDFIKIEVKTRMSENIHFFNDVIAEKEFKKIGNNIGLQINYDNEIYIYNTLLEKTKIKCNKVYVSNSIDIILTEEQLEAVSVACNNSFTIITGPAGTGKTTVIKTILHYLENDLDTISLIQNTALCSLSAKASKRMEEVTGHKATTIHRLLGYNGKTFRFDKDNTLPYNTIIVDEASMDNTWIFRKLLEAIKPDTKLIIVFDHAQLEPIGEGNIATDLLNSNEFPVCRLTKIHRQAEKSGIITFATAVRNNTNIIEQFFNDKFIKIGENQDMIIKFKNSILDSVINNYLEAIVKYGINNVVVITPRKLNAELSCLSINTRIQHHLTSKEKSIVHFTKQFNIKDKVIQKVNNYQKDVINGEMGFIDNIGEHEMTVDFDGKFILYRKSEFKELELAYALTVHSFQGSQADVVIVGIDNSSFIMLNNKLLYTAITRASKYCLLYISESAYRKCIFNSANNNRNTFINEIKKLEIYADS